MTLLENTTAYRDLRERDRAPAGPARSDVPGWVHVCDLDDLEPDRGVCALVGDAAVAVFRCWPDDQVHAVGNVDPFSGASVLSRGIVGSVDDTVFVASPIFKERFDLRTGQALEHRAIQIPVYEVQVVTGRVLVSAHPRVLDGS